MIERPEDGLVQLQLDDLAERCPLCGEAADDLTAFSGDLVCPLAETAGDDPEARERSGECIAFTTEGGAR